MSTTLNHDTATTFVVVATIRPNTDFVRFAALRADEERQLEVLHSDGRIGAHHMAPARQTAFIEVIAADESQVLETLATLPLFQFFDLDIYATTSGSTT